MDVIDSHGPHTAIARWKPQWPPQRRCAVMLSFDVDGRTLWQARSGNPDPYVVSREGSLGDYGPKIALSRILQLLSHHDLKATFFVPGYVADNWPDKIGEIVEAGHEIGLHGYLHETFYGLSSLEQFTILDRSYKSLSRLGVQPTGFRAPSGDWSIDTPLVLRDFGLLYSSSYRGDDRPFLWTFEQGAPLVELCGHWELDDFPQFAYNDWPAAPNGQASPSPNEATFDNWRLEFDAYHAEGLNYVLMMHPQVIGTPGRLRRLEELIVHMKSPADTWFATGHDIAQWVLANAEGHS